METKQIGVISDTHGLLRQEALNTLAGSELIIHAGDIGKPEILDGLRQIAPVVAVRGNNDRADWALDLPEKTFVTFGDIKFYLLHILPELDLNPAEQSVAAVISGHSHKPLIKYQDGVLYLNPGSAGPRRFKLPISVALLKLRGNKIEPEIIVIKT